MRYPTAIAHVSIVLTLAMATLNHSTFAQSISRRTLNSEQRFEYARKQVKTQFTDMDPLIDDLFDQVKSWFIHPETRTRPLIISLWGLTGTGKTSVVRAMVEKLGLDKQFIYADMDGFSSSDKVSFGIGFAETLRDQLIQKVPTADGFILKHIVVPENPILLLDEIQKIATIENGKPTKRPNAQAVWELLGNGGKIQTKNPAYDELRSAINDPNLYSTVLGIPDDARYATDDKGKKVTTERVSLAQKRIETLPFQQALDLSHALIFIAGNLDDVLPSSRTFDSEAVTADELHQKISLVTTTHIKQGLGKIFRPEHVSRFGNRHIVVPTLTEFGFRNLIDKHLRSQQTRARQLGFNVRFSTPFRQRIYDEGVVPAQGVRPVLAMADVFANDPIASVYSELRKHPAYESQYRAQIAVQLSKDKNFSEWKFLNGPLAGKVLPFSIQRESEDAKKLHSDPELRSLVAIRLAAKTVVATEIYQQVPDLVRTNSISNGKLGFVLYKDREIVQTFRLRSELIRKMAVELAARTGAELIFGEASMASVEELSKLTTWASDMAKKGGLGRKVQANLTNADQVDRPGVADEVSLMLEEAHELAAEILAREKAAFALIVDWLNQHAKTERPELRRLLAKGWSDAEAMQFILDGTKGPQSCQLALQQFVGDPSIFKFKDTQETKIGYRAPK